MQRKFEYIEYPIIVTWELLNENEWRSEKLLQSQLNKFGAIGWELVYLKEGPKAGNRQIFITIFKREI